MMNPKLSSEGDFIAYAAYAVPGTGKIKILDVLVLDSDGNLVEETGGFHLVEISDGRITPKKVKEFVREFTEAYLRLQGIDVELPLQNIRLNDLTEISLILAKSKSMKYEAVRDLR